ncbi:MAG: HipA domain-containing protein [Polyangiaceae bacterium]|nr:HipA domain-containing protein [Polyangiaceae bacterium]
MTRTLGVFLGGVDVGRLSRREPRGAEFRLGAAYKRLPRRPVLGQRFEDDLDQVSRGKRGALPPFFANLLPEGPLRALLEARLSLTRADDFALLDAVGTDLPGALTLRFVDDGPEEPAAPVDGLAEPLLPASPRGADEGLRFSLAGVQLKFSMLRDGVRLTLPARDEAGRWIVKVGSAQWPGLCENEYSMMEWARACGLDVPECRLHSIRDVAGLPAACLAGGELVLAVRRFDRVDGGRVHQEDFAQAVGLAPEHKYDHLSYADIARLSVAFTDSDAAFDEVVRRVAFVVASGNNDAHMKNWSLVYPDGVSARLAPLYDQVSTVAWPALDRRLALALAHKKRFAEVGEEEFRALAVHCEQSPDRAARVLAEALVSFREAFETCSRDLPLPEDHRRALREHWASVPLLRAHGYAPSGARATGRRRRR